MITRAPIFAAAMACACVGGCATVNVGAVVAGDAARRAEVAATEPARADLHDASAEFERFAREVSLTAEDGMGEAARQALNVLIHGRAGEDADEEAADPTSTYLDARGFAGVEPPAVAAGLVIDIRDARIRVGAVSAAAREVAAGPAREGWERREDLRAAESVVRIARRSNMVFRDVASRLSPGIDREMRVMLERELAAYAEELDNLSAAADALSAAPAAGQIGAVAAAYADLG